MATKRKTRWLHRKTRHVYSILAFGIEEATMRPTVIYQRADAASGQVWTRPCEEFFDGRFAQMLHQPLPPPNLNVTGVIK